MTEEMKEEAPKDNSKEYNFAQLRRQKEESDRRAALSESQVNALSQKLQQLEQMIQPKSMDDDPLTAYNLERGGLVEADKFVEAIKKERELSRRFARQDAEKIVEEMIQKREKSAYGEKLRSRYSDYDAVMNPENAELLAQNDPDAAEALEYIQDDYKRREFAYKKIKKIISEKKESPKVSAQDIVEKNKTAAYHFAEGGVGVQNVPDPGNLRNFVQDPIAKREYYEKLKAYQKRGLKV